MRNASMLTLPDETEVPEDPSDGAPEIEQDPFLAVFTKDMKAQRFPGTVFLRVGREAPDNDDNLTLQPPLTTPPSTRREDIPVAFRIMTIYGTRPEAIKVAPIIKAIEADSDLESITVVTGQHREMLDQVNTMFEIVPDHDMNIMSAGQSLNTIVAKVISGIDGILEKENPNAVIVQGDTSTVMGAAVASFNRQIPVIHQQYVTKRRTGRHALLSRIMPDCSE